MSLRHLFGLAAPGLRTSRTLQRSRSVCSGRLLLQQHAVAPVSETLARVASVREAREQRTQFVLDLRVLHHVFPQAIEPGAGGVAAEPDLVSAGRLADKGDFSRVGTGTTVRAAGRADNNFLARKTNFGAERFDTVDQAGQ